MVVSLTGSRGLSMASIKWVSAVIGATASVAFYLYGPTVTPFMHAAATTTCNQMTGGNFRSYRLDWVVSAQPHWNCWDQRESAKAPRNLGWWVRAR